MFKELNNYQQTMKDNVVLQDMEFKPLKEFRGQTLKVEGFFFTDGKYGKQVCVIANGYKINMPGRAVETFMQIANNNEMLNAVLEGHLELTNIKETETKNGTTTTYTFKDC